MQKLEYSKDVSAAFDELKGKELLPKWGRDADSLNRRNVFLGELRCVDISPCHCGMQLAHSPSEGPFDRLACHLPLLVLSSVTLRFAK